MSAQPGRERPQQIHRRNQPREDVANKFDVEPGSSQEITDALAVVAPEVSGSNVLLKPELLAHNLGFLGVTEALSFGTCPASPRLPLYFLAPSILPSNPAAYGRVGSAAYHGAKRRDCRAGGRKKGRRRRRAGRRVYDMCNTSE